MSLLSRSLDGSRDVLPWPFSRHRLHDRSSIGPLYHCAVHSEHHAAVIIVGTILNPREDVHRACRYLAWKVRARHGLWRVDAARFEKASHVWRVCTKPIVHQLHGLLLAPPLKGAQTTQKGKAVLEFMRVGHGLSPWTGERLFVRGAEVALFLRLYGARVAGFAIDCGFDLISDRRPVPPDQAFSY